MQEDSSTTPEPTQPPVEAGFTASMMLADYVSLTNGKFTIVGGGWDELKELQHPSGIAITVFVPWTETNRRHKWQVRLMTLDGQSVCLETPIGSVPVMVEGELEAGRAPGSRPGKPIRAPLGFNHGPLPLERGVEYVWKLYINGENKPEWNAEFKVTQPRT